VGLQRPWRFCSWATFPIPSAQVRAKLRLLIEWQDRSGEIFSYWRNRSRHPILILVHKPFFTEPDSRHDPVREPHHLTAFASRGSESATPDRWPLTCSKLIGELLKHRSLVGAVTSESWRYLDSSSTCGAATADGSRRGCHPYGTHALPTPRRAGHPQALGSRSSR
jgi:hypothetical protein